MQTEPRVGCGAAIVDGDGRLLLIQRLTEPEAGCWGLPGGKVDLFEVAAEATAREIAEELGITIVAQELLCFVDQIDRVAGIHWVSPVYLIRNFTGTPTILEPHKHGGLGWFALADLPAKLTVPTQFAARALKQKSR
ncbi:NUDIX hydrolase [Radicibacter daui]|uniref:NUDIX hydrolase n=1 Tax=Radicibacter daui TaxID=3064829 RepID=UPI004046E008